ncbi:MAG: hypothetical protein GYA24_25305 [Candidatus Lokiarchaeota archaeon]|nr:hypothetical protein [Candidatus Lokiarchaeota archaeon]
MGKYDSIKDMLGAEFSFRQYVKAALLNENQYKEARNQLKILAKRGYIAHTSRNTYLKIKT